MKKKILAALLISISMLSSIVCADDEKKCNDITGFKGYEWGASIHDIESNESKPNWELDKDYTYYDNYYIIVNDKVSDYNCYTYFQYDKDDNLVGGEYIIQVEHTNDEKYYSDFKDLVAKISQVYGDPTNNVEKWNRDLYKNKPEKIGFAVSIGDLILGYDWEDQDGDFVAITYFGDNFKSHIGIKYMMAGVETEENVDGL